MKVHAYTITRKDGRSYTGRTKDGVINPRTWRKIRRALDFPHDDELQAFIDHKEAVLICLGYDTAETGHRYKVLRATAEQKK